jgi:HK97 gp10 family phage protein
MGSDQSISISGLADLQKMLDELPAKIEANIMRGALRQGANVYRDRARNAAPVGKTGKLKKSIKVKTTVKRGKAVSQVVAGGGDAFYAKFVEFGTASFYEGTGRTVGGPYKMNPKRKEALKFGDIFSETAIHQGVRPTGFMRKAFDGGTTEVIDQVADYIRMRIGREIVKSL